MTIDRYTKAVLTVIAVALVMLAAQPLLATRPAAAVDGPRLNELRELERITTHLERVRHFVFTMSEGVCGNPEICRGPMRSSTPPE